VSAPIAAILREGERLHYALFELKSLCRRWYWRKHVLPPGAAKDTFGRYYMPPSEESEIARRHHAIVQDFVRSAEQRAAVGRAPTLELQLDADYGADEKTRPVEVRQ
jgi:hypothetical protein